MLKRSMFLFFFVTSQIFSNASAHAESSAVSGKIQRVTSLGGDRFELTVKEGKNESRYVIDRSTLIQAVVPAKKVKKGGKILLLPKAEIKGTGGINTGLGNLSPGASKYLGLPNVPNIPKIPRVPQIPKLPDILRPPESAQNSKKSDEDNSVSAAEDQAGVAPQGLIAELQGGKQPKKNEPSAQEPPKDTLSKLIPQSLSSSDAKPQHQDLASSGATAYELEKPVAPKRVVQLKSTKGGLEMQLEGEGGETEKVVLSPDENVVQVLDAEDLHENMTVSMEILEDFGEKVVKQINVA